MKHTLGTGLFCAALLFGHTVITSAEVIAGPFTNAVNGHVYYLLHSTTWLESQREANRLGGQLVTINDAVENQWILETFGNVAGVKRLLWMGLTDDYHPNAHYWASGEASTYRNWCPPYEPSGGSEHYVCMYRTTCPSRAGWRENGTTFAM